MSQIRRFAFLKPKSPSEKFVTFHVLLQMMVGWLVVFGASRPFKTVFMSISNRLPERGRKKRKERRENNV